MAQLKYQILHAGEGWYGLPGWVAEPCYYWTTGPIHSIWLVLTHMRREAKKIKKSKGVM